MFEQFLYDLKFARKKSGLTQADCGHLIGVAGNVISQIELGERIPTAQQICALSIILGTSFESFYSENLRLVRSLMSENLEAMPEAPAGWMASKARKRSLERLSEYLKMEPSHEL